MNTKPEHICILYPELGLPNMEINYHKNLYQDSLFPALFSEEEWGIFGLDSCKSFCFLLKGFVCI